MDSDLDPFEDILPKPAFAHPRAGGKFQPKAKPRLGKVKSASLSSVPPSNVEEISVSSFSIALDATKFVQSVHNVDDGLTSLVESALVSPALLQTEETLENTDDNLQCEPVNSSSQLAGRREDLASPDAVPLEVVVTNSKNNGDSSLSITEADSSQLDLAYVASIVPGSAESKKRSGGKSETEDQSQPAKETLASFSLKPSDGSNNYSITVIPTVYDATESLQSVDVTGDRSKEIEILSLTTSFVDKEPGKDNDGSSSHEKRNLGAANLLPTRTENVSPVGTLDSEAAASDGNSDWNSSLVKSTEDVGSLGFDLDPLDDILPNYSANTSRAGGKFQPKAKTRPRLEISAPVSSSLSNCTTGQPATVDLVDSYATKSLHSVDDPALLNLDTESEVLLKENEILSPDDDSNLELLNPSSIELALKKNVSSKDVQLVEAKSRSYDQKCSDIGEPAIEVNSVGLDVDPFDDTVPPPPVTNVRAGGKFQPRPKTQLKWSTSEVIAHTVASTTEEEPGSLSSTVTDKLQSAKSIDACDGRLTDPVDSSLTTLENMVIKEPLSNNDCTNPEVLLSNNDRSIGLANSSQLVATDSLHSGFSVRVPVSGLVKSMGEHADVFSGLEYIHDFGAQFPSSTEIQLPASSDESKGQSRFPARNSLNFSPLRACNVPVVDVITPNEAAVQIDNGRPESEESGPSPDLETPDILSESTTVSEHCTRKFQPKLKVQTSKGQSSASILPPDTAVPPPNAQFVPSETVYINEGTIPTFPSDYVLHYSSMDFGNLVPPDSTISEFPVNEEQINLVEASCSSDANVLLPEDVPGLHESSKGKKRKSSSLSISSQNSKLSSLAGDMNESGKSSRQLRKRSVGLKLVDESDDEAYDSDNFTSEPPCSSIGDGEDNDYDYRVDDDREENTFSRTTASKKSKKPVAEKAKPARRHKRDKDAPEQSTQEPRKKFSHSTRRKNRLKDLLSIPEDEIIFQKLPFRDIILLAGHKESLAIKELKASKNALVNQSTANSLHGEGSHNEDDATSEQDGHYIDDQSNSLFNSHSFMDKTPTARWSKQDTELFYEGIRQFGTDLSMIQQLFPGRTRHQMKLKYKKEERQHPLRLSEALNNRANDHSYFEKVIEQLQQVAAQAEQNSNRGDSVGLTDEETEANLENNEEVEKTEVDEDATNEDQEGDPLQPVDDDDLDIWGSYKSEF